MTKSRKQRIGDRTLRGSDTTLEKLRDGISRWYYGATIKLVETDLDGVFDVHNLNGKIASAIVIADGPRYRFYA